MAAKVIDASALAALLFGEPEAEDVLARIGDALLAAPAILPFEIASVCLKKIRHHPGQRESLLSAHELAGRLEIAITGVEPGEVLLLAEEVGLTICDAAYLWLARRLGAELLTLDRKLAQSWSRGAAR